VPIRSDGLVGLRRPRVRAMAMTASSGPFGEVTAERLNDMRCAHAKGDDDAADDHDAAVAWAVPRGDNPDDGGGNVAIVSNVPRAGAGVASSRPCGRVSLMRPSRSSRVVHGPSAPQVYLCLID